MRSPLKYSMLLLAAVVLLVLCVFVGASGIGSLELIKAVRVNRVLAGFLVGGALSCAGVVFQSLLRNPLAEPFVLGVSSGAGLGAAIAILTGISLLNVFVLPGFAFIGGSITLFVVYALSRDGGVPSVYGLILSGVIISSVCSSIIMSLVYMAPVEGMHSVVWWMLGDLMGVPIALLRLSAGVIICGCAAVWMLAPELNALTLGRETAHNVGVRTDLVVVVGLALSTLITAAAVGMAGLIGFVGLIVPHVLRHIVGPDHRVLVPASVIGGGVFLAVCDAVARVALLPFEPGELPVGVVTALCGGPFFLMILRRNRRKGWIG